jgi:hypothetical protein
MLYGALRQLALERLVLMAKANCLEIFLTDLKAGAKPENYLEG